MKNNKNIMVDMSATIIHHGHIRLLKKASKFGRVYVRYRCTETGKAHYAPCQRAKKFELVDK